MAMLRGIARQEARQDEFPSALREDRGPWHNAVVSANWTCVGIGAHESARKGGDIVRLPGLTLTT